jgi:putative peptide maturation system protein
MNEPFRQALLEALEFLTAASRAGLRPAQARAHFRPLRERHAGAEMELVWEAEAYDRATHYDALLRLPGEGTVALSFCPDRALPWPLRGVHRWDETALVRVNQAVLRVDQAMAFLDFIWDEAPVIDRLVHACLIREALERDPLPLSDGELQEALDAFRRAHKLYTAVDTHRWMERHGMTHERLEALVTDEATVAKLRDRVAAGRVDDYFEAHRAEFDAAHVARLEFPDEGAAARAADRVRGGAAFYREAEGRFQEGGTGGLFATLRRGEAGPEEAAVFRAAPGDVVGPVRTGSRYALLRLLSQAPARLDEATRTAIKRALFEQWLTERRQEARVEWFWGNGIQTSAV